MITAFTSTFRKVCRSYLQTGAKTRRATLHAVEEDSAVSTAWSAASNTVEKREGVLVATDMTTCLTKRSAEDVTNLTSLEGNLVAEARLDEMMLDTAGLKEVTGTDMSLHGVVTTTATAIIEGAEAQKGVEVATGTRGEDSAAKFREAINAIAITPLGILDGNLSLMHALVGSRRISEGGLAVNDGKRRRVQVTVSFVVSTADTSRPHSAFTITIDTRAFVYHANSERIIIATSLTQEINIQPRNTYRQHVILRQSPSLPPPPQCLQPYHSQWARSHHGFRARHHYSKP